MIEDLKPKNGVLIEGFITEVRVSHNYRFAVLYKKPRPKLFPLMQDDIDYLTMRNYKPNGALIEAYLTECTSGGKTTLKAKLKSVNNILN